MSAPTPSATGYAIVVVSAVAFAGNNVFSALSYEGGTTPLALITVRMALTLGVLVLLSAAFGLPMRLARQDRFAALGLGLLNGAMAFCLMSAFEHVAVGLAILVFYIYPALTAFGAWLIGQERLTRGLVIGLAGSFAGLALALEVEDLHANVAGLAFAATAAVLLTFIGLISNRVMRTAAPWPVTLHVHISAVSMFVIASLVTGDFALPGNERGWIGFATVPVVYTVAIVGFFVGIARIGAVRSSLLMNLEPVVSIALGFVILGQALHPQQLLGAAIVIASITALKLPAGRRN